MQPSRVGCATVNECYNESRGILFIMESSTIVFTRERLFMLFIREILFIVFTEERSFLLSNLHVQCIKVKLILYYSYTYIFYFVLYFSCLNGYV